MPTLETTAPGPVRLWKRLVDALPKGQTLPDAVWLRRHHALLALLWLHAVGLTIFAALRGYGPVHVMGHAAALVALAGIASALGQEHRRAAAACVSLGLITASALLVHTWGGVIEGHFHFFVMIALLALYEDWLPFLLAFAYVVLHHGVTGAIDPSAVYNHPDAIRHPWKWAGIHGGFVLAAGAASVVTWRLNEDHRAETQEAYRQARESEERFKSAFEDAPNGMVLATIEPERAGRFLQVNRAMCELTGHSEEQLIGKRFSDITHPDDADLSVALKLRALEGELSSYDVAKRYVHADGHVIWAQVYVSLVRDSSGQPMYTIAQLQDITERRRAEKSLLQSGRQLAEAQKLAQIGSWERDIETGKVIWSEELYRIFGIDPGRPVAREEIMERVHAEDRPLVEEAVQGTIQTGEPFRTEMRIVREDGAVRLVDAYGETLEHEDGRAAKLVGTVQDVTERRQVERDLALRQEAEKEHQARSEFLSRISHELRTPLNAILGFAQLLEMDDLEQPQRENVELIMKGGHHLLELINEVLEISRIEAGSMTVSVEPVNVSIAVSEVVDLMSPLAAQHGVSLENMIDAGDVDRYVDADRQRLKQVLLNLISNAIKYNREGGSVRISVESRSSDRVLILVTDTGRGIAADKLAKVFTPFDRLGAEQTAIEGTGLGLTLSKYLLEAMGGSLGVESEPWIGSTFIAGLPAAEAPVGEGEPAARGSGVGAANGSEGLVQSVLYVEDNSSNLSLVERVLAKRPHVSLLTAMEGGLGLELARQHRPALVLLDLHLPGMNGEELLRRLKSDPATAHIPVVAVSADATSSRIQRVLADGAEAFLTKPLDVPRFLALVDDALREKAVV